MCFAGIALCYVYEEPLLYDTFPDDFVWGAATAAYQVILGLYSETRFHIGMECNFVCSHGADPIAEVKLLISPFLRWSLDYEIKPWVFE